MGAPIERFKDSYKNWRWNPFTAGDMAVVKQEDNLIIPGGSPFIIQLIEQPRKEEPTSVAVYCHDDLAWFVEVATAPAQGQFRVDYPPEDGEGTGLIEFNNLDNGKEVRIDYMATGSPALAEFLDTKITYPPGSPADHQVIAVVSGASEWRYNPVCYFHAENVIYNLEDEDQSCLLFRFKKTANQGTVILELKGAKMHQGLYTELPSHLHAFGTLATGSESAHTHAKGTFAADNANAHTHAKGSLAADAVGNHGHGKGTLAGTQPDHFHGVTGSTMNTNLAHTHADGTYQTDQASNHNHPNVEPGAGDTGMEGAHAHDVTGTSGAWSIANLHDHAITFNSANGGNEAVTITGDLANGGGHGHVISGITAEQAAHGHVISGTSAAGSAHNHSISGSTALTGDAPKTYSDSLKVYVNGVDKTAELLALSPLAAFGDGTAGHAFITTGSGELDMSALVAANQFHEIKVTEPTAAKGGKVLLHMELY